jgi:hypothetical protein
MATPKITRAPTFRLLETRELLTIRQQSTKLTKRLLDNTPKHSLGQAQPGESGLEFMAERGLADGFGHIAGCLEKGFELLPGNEDLPQRF